MDKHRSLSYAEKMASSFLVAFSFDNLSIGQKNNAWTVEVHYFFLLELAFFCLQFCSRFSNFHNDGSALISKILLDANDFLFITMMYTA